MDFSDRTPQELDNIVRDASEDPASIETLTDVFLTAMQQADACAEYGQESFRTGCDYVTVVHHSMDKLSRIATGAQVKLYNKQYLRI